MKVNSDATPRVADPIGEFETALKSASVRLLSRAPGHAPQALQDSISYSLLSPGKRIRPRIALTVSHLLELPKEAALAAAVSVEMVHCFTLIHDDLPCMDNDDFRRGLPTNHKKFGEGIALLAGDSLMAMAVEALLEASPRIEASRVLKAVSLLSWAMGPRGVIGGQAEEPALGPGSKLAQLQRMHALKTGALFEASCLIPRELAGLSGSSREGMALQRFATELGAAFQAADDLEDAKPAQPDPTSLLSYQSVDEIESDIGARLQACRSEIASIWGARGEPLQAFLQEVQDKLARAAGSLRKAGA